jgi:hypothetical protein
MRARVPEGVAVTALILLVSGCSPAGEASSGAEITIDDVKFTGPWASEFAEAYGKAENPFVKGALKDGRISDREFSEMEEKFRSCLADASVGFDGFGPGGSYHTTNLDGISTESNNEATERCSREVGEYPISPFYFRVKANPQNLDDVTITAECLVRKKAVAPGYTAKDYKRDAVDFSFPFLDEEEGRRVLEVCTYDPLGLIGEE